MARFATGERRCASCAIDLPADLSLGLRPAICICAACAREKPPVDATLAAVPYDYPWSTLIGGFKFGDEPGWAAFFAGLLAKTPGVSEKLVLLDSCDWIVPMPLSVERLQSRGFNQAWELASALVRQIPTRATPDAKLLLRVKHMPPQSQLRREARLANVRGAFQVDPLRAAELAGRRVVLVDDVMTSGASVFAAARALRDAGAAEVTAVVLARTAA